MGAKWKCEEREGENGLIHLRIVLDGEPLGWLITPPGLPKKNTQAYNKAIKRAKRLIEACNTHEQVKEERDAGLDICHRLMGYFKFGTSVSPSTLWCDRITAKEMVEKVIALCGRKKKGETDGQANQ